MSGGINTPKEKLTGSQLYQAIHYEMVASALAVKIGHEIHVEFAFGDTEILKNTVDFISFSYYVSVCATADEGKKFVVRQIPQTVDCRGICCH